MRLPSRAPTQKINGVKPHATNSDQSGTVSPSEVASVASVAFLVALGEEVVVWAACVRSSCERVRLGACHQRAQHAGHLCGHEGRQERDGRTWTSSMRPVSSTSVEVDASWASRSPSCEERRRFCAIIST